MRAGTNKKDWIYNEAGAVIGLSLGFDFCHEHEEGVKGLHRILGVPSMEFPVGTGDRKISVSPDNLEFVEYQIKPKDKRRKQTTPAASLILTHRGSYRPMTHEEQLKSFSLNFYTNVYDKWYKPELDDLMCSWSQAEFAVNVRGAENISRLRELYEAFQRTDISLAHPSSRGFLRTGLSFVIASRIPADVEEVVRAQDLAHQRLYLAAKATGVYEMLEKAGLGYHALGPGWENSEREEGVEFFLNPHKQDRFNFGWFSVNELEQWANGTGPVIKDAALIAFDKAQVDWQIHVLRGLKEQGLYVRRMNLVWLDDEKTKVGVRVTPYYKAEESLPGGIYPFDELLAKYGTQKEAAPDTEACL